MLKIRCKNCGKELTSSSKLQVCGCPNMMTLIGDKITANDLSLVVELSSSKYSGKKQSVFSKSELEFQESRKKRKIRKLDFEVK